MLALPGRFHEVLENAGLPRLRLHDRRHTFETLAVQAFPPTDVKAYMGHADISTTMINVHHVPRVDAADRLLAWSLPRSLCPVCGPFRDTLGTKSPSPEDAPEGETGSVTELSEWARQDSNLGPTDYESAALTS